MPAIASIARRPLLISLVCINLSAAGSFGFNPRGSKYKSPTKYYENKFRKFFFLCDNVIFH